MYTAHGVGQCMRLATLAAALCSACAFADDYAPVSELLRNGQLADAMLKADQYLAKNPRDPQMRFLKGLIQQDSGQQAQAVDTYTRLTEEYPELPEPHNNVAVLYAAQGQYDRARLALEMATRTSPRYAVAHENLGDVYARLAGQAYGQALLLEPGNAALAPKLALIRQLFAASAQTRSGAAPDGARAPAAATPAGK